MVVRGWEPGLRLLADNLLENAARHGRADGAVRVRCRRRRARARSSRTTGPGIAEAERERIFEPFARVGDGDVPGSGLGLALVAQQARPHGAVVEVGSPDLGGARFDVSFAGSRGSSSA